MTRLDYAISAGSLGLAVAVAVAVAGIRSAPTPRPVMARPAYLPDPRLTPGAVIPGIDRSQTCDPAWTHRSRNVPESLRLAVFKAYGRNPPTTADREGNELDHRVPVALGGESSIRNIWVQPWGGKWGAATKDRLEAALYRDVCAGRVTLAEAQAVFLGDWTVAYLARFGDPADRKFGASGDGGDDDEGDTEGFERPKQEQRP